MSYRSIIREIRRQADPKRSAFVSRYFKTGVGEYGEGDLFLGLSVPAVRKVARTFRDLSLEDTSRLLQSRFHEERMAALFIWVDQYGRSANSPELRNAIYRRYLKLRRHINNWDLVDGSAPGIVGAHIEKGDKAVLDRLARSRNIWDRRIAVLATYPLVRNGEFGPMLRLAERLLKDPEDLMHKAVGWMLREIGKRDKRALNGFLEKHCRRMPRTMLRYAIEKHSPAARRKYMKA